MRPVVPAIASSGLVREGASSACGGSMPQVRRRLAVVLPFVSGPGRRHAAADTVEPAVVRLAERHDVGLFVPGVARVDDLPPALRDSGVTLLPSTTSPGSPARARLTSGAPWAVRADWSRANVLDARAALSCFSPEVVLGEYVQSSEALALLDGPSVLTLHDASAEVLARAATEATGPLRAYRLLEARRMARFERAALRSATRLLVLSAEDRMALGPAAADAQVLRFGIDLPAARWTGGTARPTVVFAGALWRHANQAIARHCLDAVMPGVWTAVPDARFRLVGDGPPADLVARAGADPRVEVTGYVEDLDAALLEASVVLAPARVGGGVLLKVLRSMALGIPVVTNGLGARGVAPSAGAALVVDGAAALAAATVELLEDPTAAARIGAAGRHHVAEHCSWAQAMATYDEAFTAAIGIGVAEAMAGGVTG